MMARNAYRMIAIDLDGTLLSPSGKVTQRARAAVHRALDAGLLVCFATGRNFTESRAIIDDVGHYASAVFVGGAMVIDTKNRVTLHRMLMEPALAAEVCELFESAGHAALAVQDTDAAGFDYLMSDDVPLNAATQAWMKVTSATLRRVKNLGSYKHEHTIRCGIVDSVERIGVVKQQLQERFAERIVHHSLFVPAYDVEVLEVFDASVNKWEGIQHVAKAHGILPEQIIAIGDDVNDLHMIRNAGLGVAMGNARPEVIQIAKRVIGSNADEGLAAFLDEIVENHTVRPIEEIKPGEDTPATDAA